MSGTRTGGLKAAKTNRDNYGTDFYIKIGSKGGKLSKNGGFGQGEIGRARARIAGRKGGLMGGRRKPMEPDLKAIDERLWELYLNKCEQRGIRPRIKDYLIWLSENYD